MIFSHFRRKPRNRFPCSYQFIHQNNNMVTVTTAYEKAASSYSAFSANGQASCKLPILDGDAKAATRTIVVEIGLNQGERLCELPEKADGSFEAAICTAWALLLRCYTGQDQVCFELTGDVKDECTPQSKGSDKDHSVFNMGFQEGDVLSTCIRRANTSHSPFMHGLCRNLPTASNTTASVSRPWNTTVSIQRSGPGMLGHRIGSPITHSLDPSQVNLPTLPPWALHTNILTLAAGKPASPCHIFRQQSDAQTGGAVLRRIYRLSREHCQHL